MATIDDIKAYVRETPYNTNLNVLNSLLDGLNITNDEVEPEGEIILSNAECTLERMLEDEAVGYMGDFPTDQSFSGFSQDSYYKIIFTTNNKSYEFNKVLGSSSTQAYGIYIGFQSGGIVINVNGKDIFQAETVTGTLTIIEYPITNIKVIHVLDNPDYQRGGGIPK